MEAREQRGLEIAARSRIAKGQDGYVVPSQSGKGLYTVNLDGLAPTHLMCGVKTNIVTSVEVTPTGSNDAPYLAPFVQTTARNFTVNEVSGDKAYLS